MRSAPLPVTSPPADAPIEYKDADRIRIDYRQSCMLGRFLRARVDAGDTLSRKIRKSWARKGWHYVWTFPHSGDGHFYAY
jgi:hypothetical protein